MFFKIILIFFFFSFSVIFSYNPLQIIQNFHSLPHLNSKLKEVDNNFGITSESRWNSYTDSLIPFPFIIGILGITIIIIPIFILISRLWCKCSKCLPIEVNEYLQTMMIYSPSKNPNFDKVVKYRQYALTAFVACIFGLVIMNQGVFFGESTRRNAVREAEDSLASIKSTFRDLTSQGYELQLIGGVIESDLNYALSTCPEAQSAYTPLSVYQYSIEIYLDMVSPIPSSLSDIESYLYYWAVTFRNQMIWLIYGMVWMIVGIFGMSICMQSQGSLKFGIGTGFLIAAVLLSLLNAIIYLLMMSADFCMDPTPNAIGLTEESNRDLAEYYSSCNGTNPISEPIESAFVSLELIDTTITELSESGGKCEGNLYLLHCSDVVEYAKGNLTILLESALCEPVKNDWDDFFQEAVCRDGYQGLFDAWIADYSTVFMLYLTLLVGCCSYQYIGSQWKIDFDEIEQLNASTESPEFYFSLQRSDDKERNSSIPYSYLRPSQANNSDGSGGGRSPQSDLYGSYYVDSNHITPLIPQTSRDSDDIVRKSSEAYPTATPVRYSQKTTRESLVSSNSSNQLVPSLNRNSQRYKADLIPTYSKHS